MDTGKCTEKACGSRTVNTTGNANTPCGSGDCYYDQGNTLVANSCNTICSNPEHYTTTGSTNHTCLLMGCNARTANNWFAIAAAAAAATVAVVVIVDCCLLVFSYYLLLAVVVVVVVVVIVFFLVYCCSLLFNC